MSRITLTAAFIALVAVPLTGVYLVRSGFYPAAIANGQIIGARSFGREVQEAARAQPTLPLAALRRTVLDRMIESAILAREARQQFGADASAVSAWVESIRRQARVVILEKDLTWRDGAVVAR